MDLGAAPVIFMYGKNYSDLIFWLYVNSWGGIHQNPAPLLHLEPF